MKNKYPVFGYDFKKIIEHCLELKSTIEQIVYLEGVLSKYNSQFSEPLGKTFQILRNSLTDFSNDLKNEINRRKELLDLERKHLVKSKIVWRRKHDDLVHLFDLLKDKGFISDDTKDEQLSEHFSWIGRNKQIIPIITDRIKEIRSKQKSKLDADYKPSQGILDVENSIDKIDK